MNDARRHQCFIAVHATNEGGLDHGIWTVLRHMYPQADIAVLPLAFVPTQSPAQPAMKFVFMSPPK